MTLKEFFTANLKAALAFSGGADSAYLLYAAKEAGADIKPYFIKTPFQPAFELEDAKKLAKELGTELTVIDCYILENPAVRTNPADRCYHCKHQMFSLLKAKAKEDGYSLVIDGTNASDDVDDRPGMRAIVELGVRSPLRECGLNKQEIRQLSKEAGLFTWNKPAYACLATRIPAGTPIELKDLERTEAAEETLHQLGLRDFRVRLIGDAAKIQVPCSAFSKVLKHREEIVQNLKKLYSAVLLDLEGRDEQ